MCHCAVIWICCCILSDKCCCLERQTAPQNSASGVTRNTLNTALCRMSSTCNLLISFSVRADIIYNEFSLKKINIISALFHFLHLIIITIRPLLLLLLLLLIAIHTILLIALTSHTTLTIRYLQLWNPLHQCQSGQPHRWVQRCPLQEVRGSDRFSRGGRCAWGGAPEHYSMTYDPKASQLTSTPMAVHSLNCCHQGLTDTHADTQTHTLASPMPTWNQNSSATGCKESHLLQCSLVH